MSDRKTRRKERREEKFRESLVPCIVPSAAASDPSLATALTQLVIWANYPGHADGVTEPPPVDLKKLARSVRLLLAEQNRQSDNAVAQLVLQDEVIALRRDVLDYQRQLAKFYRERCDSTPNPWDEVAGAGEPTNEQSAPGAGGNADVPRKPFRYPEDDIDDPDEARVARGSHEGEDDE